MSAPLLRISAAFAAGVTALVGYTFYDKYISPKKPKKP